MANQKGILKEGQGNALRPAAKPTQAAGSLGGAKIGGGAVNKTPAWYNEEYQNYMSPAKAGDISNPNVPVQAIALDAPAQNVQQQIKQASYNKPFIKWNDPAPAWIRNIMSRPAAYGGGYNPTSTNPAYVAPAPRDPAYGGAYDPTSNNPDYQAPDPTRDPAYGGVYDPTVNNPAFPDAAPVDPGFNNPHPYRPMFSFNNPHPYRDPNQPVIVYPPPAPAQGGDGGRFGFSTRYGGNWGGGGGGGGGGGDYGYSDSPAWWNPEMGLYSFKFGW